MFILFNKNFVIFYKPSKINDEIIIISQSPKIQNLSVKSSNSNKQVKLAGKESSTPKAKV